MARAITADDSSTTRRQPVRRARTDPSHRRRIKLRRPHRIPRTAPRRDSTEMVFSNLIHMDLRAKPSRASELLAAPPPRTTFERAKHAIGDTVGSVSHWVTRRRVMIPLALGVLAGLVVGMAF